MGDLEVSEAHTQANNDNEPSANDGPRTAKAKVAVSSWVRSVHRIYITCVHRGFCAFFALPLVLALVFKAQNRHYDVDQCKAREKECGFVGNEDAYGLGIRLGVYLQWLSVFMVVYVFPSEERPLMTTLITFSSALMVAVLVLTFDHSCTYTVEIIVMLWTAIMTEALASLTNTAQEIMEEGIREVPSSSGLKRMTTFQVNLDHPEGMHGIQTGSTLAEMGICGYAAWFWVYLAMGSETVFASTPCGTSLFFLARVQGRTGTTVISVMMAMASLGVLLFRLFAWAFHKLTNRWLSEQTYQLIGLVAMCIVYWPIIVIGGVVYMVPESWVPKRLCEMDDKGDGREPLMNLVASTISFAVSVVGIELLLVWNGVSDVYGFGSTGQLIPLSAGLMSLLPMLWKLLRRYMAGQALLPEPVRRGKGVVAPVEIVEQQGPAVATDTLEVDQEAPQLR